MNDPASKASPDSLDTDDLGDAPDGFDVIPFDTCSEILRGGEVGILALQGASAPDLRPINFGVSRNRVVMRTARGRVFEGARLGEEASFVLIDLNHEEHLGRSIVVTGKLSICDPADAAMRTKLGMWSKAIRPERVLLTIETITGRRLASRC